MAVQASSVQRPNDSESVMQQVILQQAQAVAAAAQTGPTRSEAPLQNTDLVSLDVTEDGTAPPAYGDVYGEIHNEKEGLGTSASVANDGRVNIRINHINRHLSQLITPALRQENQNAQQDHPHSLSPFPSQRQDGASPPPPLNIVIQVVGSRGDVQPFIALGKVLKNTYGHRVRLATHSNFKNFVEENGLEFFNIGGDPSRLMAFMAKNPSLMPGFRSLFSGDVSQQRKEVSEYIQGCWRSCYEAGDGIVRATDVDLLELSSSDPSSESAARPFVADCIIANPPSFAHIHCAEKLGIPLHIMFTMPYSPTQAFPHPLANIQSSNADPQLTNFMSYAMIELLSWQGIGDIMNRFRKKCLGLDPVSLIWAPGMLHRLKVPHTYCWSPALIPKPKDWGPYICVSGHYKLDSADYVPAADLQAFLDAGPPPVYIGFGSIVLDDPNAMTELIFDSVRKSGQRVLLSKGWGGIGADNIPDGVFMIDNVPHDWLFKHVACVVHHGGAGTTAAGITAGRPNVIIPFFGDQPFWGAMVARAGAGPTPIPVRSLTADKLTDAVNFCLTPESQGRAKELASMIAAEQGSDVGAQSFHHYLEVDRLRCTLAPSRTATWRVKRTKVRLSAFAACTLANANLLDFHDLKLFRLQEYCTDEGPWDPISGGFTAALRAVGGMAMGIADVPTETWKAMQMPFGGSRQQNLTTMPTSTANGGSSRTAVNSVSLALPEQSQTSLISLPDPSALYVSTASGSQSDMLQGQWNSKVDDSTPKRVRSRAEPGSGRSQDMLRRTGAHTSKGLGRFAKALVLSPMELSVSFTKGFHNVPKLWGDDTVRPQEQVTDLKSGLKAVGREFGFGWYDGVTGLVTQPWQGAQKEGASGFLKGVGKGIGGFVTKPGAALCGVLGHTMKGVHKEVQKLFGSNVQNYIVASRAAQGYEEWLQSSDAEKQDVVDRWKRIQKYLKKKHNADEMMQDVLGAPQNIHTRDRVVRNVGSPTSASAHSATVEHASTEDIEGDMLATGDSQSSLRLSDTASEDSLQFAEIQEITGSSGQVTTRGNPEEDADVAVVGQEHVHRLHCQPVKAADHQASQELSYSAETVGRSNALQDVENESLRAKARTSNEQSHGSGQSHQRLDTGRDTKAGKLERARPDAGILAEMSVVAAGLSGLDQTPAYDPGHLEDATHSRFEAQQRETYGEKSAQQKTEEEIVIEYIKKQSLLEAYHQSKGKGRATATEPTNDEDDEDLHRALKLSLQERGSLQGEASGV